MGFTRLLSSRALVRVTAALIAVTMPRLVRDAGHARRRPTAASDGGRHTVDRRTGRAGRRRPRPPTTERPDDRAADDEPPTATAADRAAAARPPPSTRCRRSRPAPPLPAAGHVHARPVRRARHVDRRVRLVGDLRRRRGRPRRHRSHGVARRADRVRPSDALGRADPDPRARSPRVVDQPGASRRDARRRVVPARPR